MIIDAQPDDTMAVVLDSGTTSNQVKTTLNLSHVSLEVLTQGSKAIVLVTLLLVDET